MDYRDPQTITKISLVQAIKENDQVFLKEFYISNFNKFRQFISNYKSKERYTKQIYQEAFVTMWRNLKREEFVTEDQDKLNQYLYQIAKQKWATHRKMLRYKNTIFINREIEFEEITEQEEILDDKIKQVISAQEKLGDTCNQLLRLYYFERKGYKAMAKIMGLGEVSVHYEKYHCQEELFKYISFLHKLPQHKDQQQVDDYLLDRIQDDDLTKLSQKIIAFPEFEREIEAQRILVMGVEEFYLKKLITDFHEEAVLLPIKKFHKKAWIALGISVLLLISVSIWALFYRVASPEKVFNSHFIPDPGLTIPTIEVSRYNFHAGMENYKRGAYAEAILKWEPLYAAQPDNDTLLYFLGVANLAENNSRYASKYLKLAQKDTNSIFYDEAQYYYALSLIKQNHFKSAKDFLMNSDCSKCEVLLSELKRSR